MKYEEFRQNISDNVFLIMRKKGMNQTKLAAYANVSPGTITRLLCGKRDPSLYVLWSVAKALNVPPEFLVGEPKGKRWENRGTVKRRQPE